MKPALRPILYLIGIMVAALSAAMIFPAIVDAAAGNHASARAFGLSALIGAFAGGVVTLANRGPIDQVSARTALLLTAGSWIALVIVAAVPMRLSGEAISWTDALFESVSGLTTTGATVFTGLDGRPDGLLLWRAILQWIGGVGIIVTAMAIWPMLGVGGMQLFQLENSDTSEKVLPRAQEIATSISLVYLALSAACFLGYAAVGLSWFDALCHAMTTVSTGGFSTSDNSLGAWMTQGADLVAIAFILLASLPFGLFILATRGKPGALFKDRQVRAFFGLVVAATIALTILLSASGQEGIGQALRLSAFNGLSIITGTGFATTDYGGWGPAAQAAFFAFMFIGGCAGSTTCSIKIFRYQIAGAAIGKHMAGLMRPNVITPMRYNGRPVPDSALHSVLGFFFAFFAVFVISASLLSALGLDLTTALSGAATTLGNVGPGLGETIGPAGTFESLDPPAKWIMTVNMLIGRLEVLPVLILLTPRFWRA